MKYIFIILAAVSWSCGHAGHNHEGHSHEGHDHGTEAVEPSRHADEIIFTREQADAAGLTVETVRTGEFSLTIKTGGRIENLPQGEVVVVARSGGIVSFAGALTEGATVSKGQTIATVSAHGMVDGDPAARARIEFETAEREYRRAETLIADRIISQREFDEARRRYENARAALPEGASATGVKLRTPVAGYIKNRLAVQGEFVTAGQPVATVASDDRLLLRADVPERHFDELPSVTGAEFKTSYGETLHRAGRLLSYGRAAGGGYIPVTFEFANTVGVMPGTFVEVWLTGRPVQNVLTIPVSAVSEQQGLYYVYVQLDDEGYEKREVALGRAGGERVPVLSGLSAGEKVVTNGATQVRLAAMSGIIPEGHSHAH